MAHILVYDGGIRWTPVMMIRIDGVRVPNCWPDGWHQRLARRTVVLPREDACNTNADDVLML